MTSIQKVFNTPELFHRILSKKHEEQNRAVRANYRELLGEISKPPLTRDAFLKTYSELLLKSREGCECEQRMEWGGCDCWFSEGDWLALLPNAYSMFETPEINTIDLKFLKDAAETTHDSFN
tara:strand:+ start:268 stop:633 length:366 start_codon:yes stop_codon:yes gene_type:complete